MVKYLPSNVGVTGSIPAPVTEILHDAGQCSRAHAIRVTCILQQRPSEAKIIFFKFITRYMYKNVRGSLSVILEIDNNTIVNQQ